MFLATKKIIFNDIKFDESIFKGFHCYDIDFSLQILKKYKVVVNYNILIEHLSPGSFNLEWLKETKKLQNKWFKDLPITSIKLNKIKIIYFEFKAFENFFRLCKKYNMGLSIAFFEMYNFKYISKIGIFCFIGINVLLLYKIFLLILKSLFFFKNKSHK
jgi:hypothetical protein